MRAIFGLLLISAACNVHADEFDRNQIKERIKPIGQVRVEGATQIMAEKKITPPAKKTSDVGEEVYTKYCAVCHKTGLAGAPKFRDESSWKSRMKAKDLDALTASAIKGIRAMPAKGTCMECSNEDIKKAVSYMLPK